MDIGLRKVSRTSVGRYVTTLISAFVLLCAGAAPAAAVIPVPPPPLVLHIRVAAISVPMPNTPASVTNAVAACPVGTALVGGGIQVGRADPADAPTPTNGLRVKGTYPSDATGGPVANFAINPRHWTAEGTFGGQSEAGDQVTSFAMCATAGSALRLVAVASINGPTAPATTASVTATCPAGTTLVGGGAWGTPANSQSFRPVGSFPSDASGAMVPHGARNPQSWTAIGSAGGMADPANVTTAFAVCSIPPLVQTTVVRVDAPGPTTGSTFTVLQVTVGKAGINGSSPRGVPAKPGGFGHGSGGGGGHGGAGSEGGDSDVQIGAFGANHRVLIAGGGGASNGGPLLHGEDGGGPAGSGDAPTPGVNHGNGKAIVSFQYGTSTQLTANPVIPLFGHPVTVTATINPGNPTAGDPSGAVTFSDGATPLAMVPLSGGQASFTTTKLQPGQHSITAGYSGDQNFAPLFCVS